MDAALNPYVPGAGRTPIALVGRDRELNSWQTAISRVALFRTSQPLVLYGLRGVGKTVLLNRMRSDAEKVGWITAKVEAGAGKTLREALGESLRMEIDSLRTPTWGERANTVVATLSRFVNVQIDSTGSVSLGFTPTSGVPTDMDSRSLEIDLLSLIRELCQLATTQNIGVALLIDEAQDLAKEELLAICATAHESMQRDWPLLIALAGLPSLPKDLAEAKSYAERLFDYRYISALSHEDSVRALREPSETEGVGWEEAAVDLVAEAAEGYPYFLQQYGLGTWNQAETGPFSVQAAQLGVAMGLLALDNGFFRSRWDRATPQEQAYLRAMAAEQTEEASSGAVARRLGRKPESLGPIRSRLINKGLIYSPQHGVVSFTAPRMASFISRQSE